MLNKLDFYCPLEISKAENENGEEVMRLKGIASTVDEDSDGEFLDPSGFVIDDFLKVGLVNWHHMSSEKPKTIIGEPTKAQIKKEGFYVEVDLYPSSAMAREVYEVAEILEKDSKTRKLGFSIEGEVLERASQDKKHPDYKIVKKAKITGLAVTHMPKNGKTFAEILKACKTEKINKDDDPCWEGYEMVGTKDKNGKKVPNCVEKDLNTSNGSALTKESVDGSNKKDGLKDVTNIQKSNYKIRELNFHEQYDLIFETFPTITIEKAERLENFLNKIKKAMSKESNTITDEQLQKAMSTLGLDDIEENPFLVKAKKGKGMSADEAADKVEEEIFSNKEEDVNRSKKYLMGEDEEDEEKKEDEKEKGKMKKSEKDKLNDPENSRGAVLILKKALEQNSKDNFKNSQALATLVKASMEANLGLREENKLIKKGLDELSEKLEKANSKIQRLSGAPQARRSLRKAVNPREKESFQKSRSENNENTLSKSQNYKEVLDLLDKSAFSKGGYDDHFAKAVMSFESTKVLPQDVVSRIKNEMGITIVD